MPETTTRIDLPGGEWAEMADPDEITSGEVLKVIGMISVDGVDLSSANPAEMAKLMFLARPSIGLALVALLCREWSLTAGAEALPVTADNVRAQRPSLLRPLKAHVASAVTEVLEEMGLSGAPDPKSAGT